MEIVKRKYILSNDGIIEIDRRALGIMLRYRQKRKTDLEAGGVLLGRFIYRTKNIIIDEVTIPFVSDIQERVRFKRGPLHQEVIDDKWVLSKGKCNYLGEWHTHPEEYPEPSNRDKKEWTKILKGDTFSSRYLYFVIIGTKDFGLWEGDRRTLKIKKLKYG